MSTFFASKNTQQGSQAHSSTPTFKDPRAQGLIDQLAGANNQKESDRQRQLQGQGIATIGKYLATPAAQVDATGAINAIRAQSAAQTPVDVAAARSKFYNRPTGRNDIAVADTIARNAATRDAAIAGTQLSAEQFNAQQRAMQGQQIANIGQYLAGFQDPNLQQTNINNQNALQLLSLLRGEEGTGSSSSVGRDRAPGAQIAGQAIGAIGAGIAMCWVARAVYGEANPTWMVFRQWMFMHAPEWLFQLYLRRGEEFAEKVKKDPALRKRVKKKMDKILLDHFKIIRN